jgi:hypothetical protein
MKALPPLVSLIASASIVAQSYAENYSTEQLTQRAIERRAVEAVIWGMPAVNYERMLQAAIDDGAKLNQVVYWSRPVNEKNQTLTPNPDTNYLNPFYDKRNGPMVVEIPKRQFEPLLRCYGPMKEFFDKFWKLPDIEEVK